jgi:hypothetical protein
MFSDSVPLQKIAVLSIAVVCTMITNICVFFLPGLHIFFSGLILKLCTLDHISSVVDCVTVA